MKALAWIGLVLTVLVGADGIYMVTTHYKASDVNNFHLSDGGTVIVAAVILLVVTILAFVASGQTKKNQSNHSSNRSSERR